MFPEIPEHPELLSAPELRSLAADIRVAVLAASEDPNLDADGFAAMRAGVAAREELLALARRKETQAQVSSAMADDSEDEVIVPDEVIQDDADADDDDDAEDDADEGDEGAEGADAGERVPVGAGLSVRTTTSVPTKRSVERITAGQLQALDGTPGKRAGDRFESWTDFAQALIEKADRLDPATREKYHVGRALGEFDAQHRLTEDMLFNLKLFEQEELTAAMCAPAVPVYDLACANTNRRPVRASFASFQPAARGAVSIYPSPTLEDITTGFGLWTNEEDSDTEAVKDPCATVECATPTTYRLYGIYRCLTVKNLLQLTFPELVEAYLNRLGAAWARLAEVTLLNAMGTAADTVEAAHVGYGGSVSIPKAILQYLTAFQELQRWDNPAMDVWMHRGVLMAIKADMISRRRTDGGRPTVPSDAEVNSIFTNAGVTPHWTLDVANWMTALSAFSTAGVLRDFPRNVEMMIAPQGKFAVLDRGELSVGVTGNGIYRDNESNRRNEFTFFFESFEGLVDTDSCPAHVVELNDVCWNGQQVADILMTCEGDDRPGQQS